MRTKLKRKPGRSAGHRRTYRSLVCLGAALLFTLVRSGCAQTLELKNTLDVDRRDEVVEIPEDQVIQHLRLPASKLSSLIATDTATGRRVPTQLFAQNGAASAKLLLLVSLPAHGTLNVSFRPDPAAPAQRALVSGREAPERKDDFAWENELVTYRIYGPALQAAGEITSGIDVWSKRVPNFVIDSFYKRDLEGTRTHNPELSYHKDNGQGLDSYYVGPTRGCGGTGIFRDGKLYVSKNYTALKILAPGPIRFAFQVSYAPWRADGTMVSEVKTIVLDAGSHMNQITSTYTFDGDSTLKIAAGLAIHEPADIAYPVAGRVASVWDTPQDASAGRIASGLVTLPEEHASTLSAANHALMIVERRSGQPFTYFAGSGWSKADMPAQRRWNQYLLTFLARREHPIQVSWRAR